MTSPGITSTLFSSRFHRPTALKPHSQPSSWASFSISRPTGHIRPGALCSALFSGWLSHLNTSVLLSSPKAVLWVLHQIQHILSISSYRAAPLLLLCIPGRPGPRTSDGQIISVRNPQHANFTGPARPTGSFRLRELLPDTSKFNPTMQLTWGDVAIDSHQHPTMVQIHLKKSNCDQFGAGSDVVVGRTGLEICPVMAIVDYTTARGDRPGPFFTLDSTTPSQNRDLWLNCGKS